MSQSNASSEQVESPIVAKLRGLAKQGQELASHTDISPGKLADWVRAVGRCIDGMYGADSETAKLWPRITSSAAIPRDAASRLSHLQRGTQRAVKLVELLEAAPAALGASAAGLQHHRVFIGHGRSLLWREFKDFLVERLALPFDEFNTESTAGVPTASRLQAMLVKCDFAFLLMTAEDQHADLRWHARANVVHEVGLFQGRLGMNRAIVLLEQGCEEFSNIHGLTHIPFPKGYLSATFEEVRRVLEREGVLSNPKGAAEEKRSRQDSNLRPSD